MAKPKLTLAELKALKPGEKIHVRYEEEGDSCGPRMDGVFTVAQIDDEMLIVEDENGTEEFPFDTWDEETQEFYQDDGHGIIRRVR